ncbi:MAG: hypothetical protein WC805_03930 [Patescibacteria group bacterium]|jgi:hypothetical protein
MKYKKTATAAIYSLRDGARRNPPAFNLIASRSSVSCDIDITAGGQVELASLQLAPLKYIAHASLHLIGNRSLVSTDIDSAPQGSLLSD